MKDQITGCGSAQWMQQELIGYVSGAPNSPLVQSLWAVNSLLPTHANETLLHLWEKAGTVLLKTQLQKWTSDMINPVWCPSQELKNHLLVYWTFCRYALVNWMSAPENVLLKPGLTLCCFDNFPESLSSNSQHYRNLLIPSCLHQSTMYMYIYLDFFYHTQTFNF